MRKVKEPKSIIEVKEEVKIGDVILEVGDEIEILTESALWMYADDALSAMSRLFGALEKANHPKASDIKRIRTSLEKAISAIQ